MSDIDLELDKQLEPILDRMWNGDYDKLYGQLPTGVTKTTTNYIKWDLK